MELVEYAASDLAEALPKAMQAAGMRDEHVAVASGLSIWTIRELRVGKARHAPRRTTVDALKRCIPGLSELLANRQIA